MPNEEQLAILRRGVEAWNAWRREHSRIRIDLGRADLGGLDLKWIDFSGADLSTADLHETDLTGANLYKANLLGADLFTADLHEADLRGASLGTANLSRTNLGRANLIGAKLVNANLREANLREAELVGADLHRANLRGADLYKANLGTSDFREANLRRADLREARLSWANLGAADLCEANLGAADLSGANLCSTTLGETVLSDTNLKDAAGLEECGHSGPSVLDHRTLEQSGPLPLAFLRGCGLTDWQIEAAKLYKTDLSSADITEIIFRIEELRATRPIQVTNLFISYSQHDRRFVERLEQHLQDRGLLYWRDEHGAVTPMESLAVREMKRATVLLVLSKKSVNSDWLEYEAQEARKLGGERERRLLCPIAVDDAWQRCKWSQVLRMQMRKHSVPDFSDWANGGDFEHKLDRFLSSLGLLYGAPAAK